MNEEKLVTIVVPIFNGENYIEECIKSLIVQTYIKIEILLIDDGSTDNTYAICHKYSKKDSRITVIKKENTGVSDTRNVGIKYGSGDYVTFVDADDKVASNYIEELVKGIEISNDVQVCFCQYKYYYGNHALEKKARLKEGIYDVNQLFNRIIDDGTITGILFGNVWAGLYNLKIIQERGIKFKEEIHKNEDGLFNIEYISSIKKIHIIKKPLYFYRQWKKEGERKSIYPLSYDLEKCTRAIEEFYEQKFPQYINTDNYQKQIRARKISILFWNSLKIINAQEGYFECVNYIKKLEKNIKKEYFSSINWGRMNLYKRILLVLLKQKRIRIYVLLCKYLYPILNKYVRR